MKSDNSKSGVFKEQILNGRALAIAVPTIQNQDSFVQI